MTPSPAPPHRPAAQRRLRLTPVQLDQARVGELPADPPLADVLTPLHRPRGTATVSILSDGRVPTDHTIWFGAHTGVSLGRHQPDGSTILEPVDGAEVLALVTRLVGLPAAVATPHRPGAAWQDAPPAVGLPTELVDLLHQPLADLAELRQRAERAGLDPDATARAFTIITAARCTWRVVTSWLGPGECLQGGPLVAVDGGTTGLWRAEPGRGGVALWHTTPGALRQRLADLLPVTSPGRTGRAAG